MTGWRPVRAIRVIQSLVSDRINVLCISVKIK